MQGLRTIETATSLDFIKTLIEEKAREFGFKDHDMIVDIGIDLPQHIPITFKFKKEKEVSIIKHGPALA